MGKKTKITVLTLLILTLTLESPALLPSRVFASPAPTLTLTPSSGPPGTNSTAAGSDFLNSPCGVNLYFDSLNGPLLAFASVENSAFSTTVTIPGNASTGIHVVIVQGILFAGEFCGGFSEDQARANFTVRAGRGNAFQVGLPAPPAVINIDLSRLPKAPPWRPGDEVIPSIDFETPSTPEITAAEPFSDGIVTGTSQLAPSSDPASSTLVQNFQAIPASLTPGNFAIAPPDTMGDVGPNHFVQVVNVMFAIYDKAGNQLAGPTGINCIWRGTADCSLPPPDGINDQCEAGGFSGYGDGDPAILYDHLADRWLISQFRWPNGLAPPWYQCITISQTGNPVTGGWYTYQFGPFTANINDYPKFGLWPDGYYMGTNCFYPCAQQWSFDRTTMLSGGVAPAPLVCPPETGLPFMLPADLDGPPPVAGTPEIFARFIDGAEFGGLDRVEMREFSVDWSTATGNCADLPDLAPAGLLIDRSICGLVFADFCLPQPGTVNEIEGASVFSMYRLQYRTFGAYDTLVFDHTVDVNGAGLAGLQWFELRKVGGAWSIFQDGIYSPDETSRWMGSTAMDGQGNIAIGYSVTSSTVYPGIRYAGRLAADPLGTLPQGEFTIADGGASQVFNCPTGSPCQRWGDYASMSIDPLDDCTFWFTTEYIANSTSAWVTRVASFRLGNCPSIFVSKYLTDPEMNPLDLDSNGNPKVDVVLANGRVRSTNPGQVMAWVNVTNTGGTSFQSLVLNETLPVDWKVDPPWVPAIGGIHVFFVLSNGTRVEITDPSTITVSTSNPQTVLLTIPDLTATTAAKSLDPGESVLLSVKLTYALIRTSQPSSSYPRNYTDTASAAAWTEPSYTGTIATANTSAFFMAYAKVLG